MRSLIVATRNPGKVQEIRAAIGTLEAWRVESLPSSAREVEETGATFVENAIQKAQAYGRQFSGWTLADDSGLAVDALDGRPGVFSARYAATNPERIQRLLEELEDVEERLRTARFVCALALAKDGRVVWTAEETVEGRIALAPKGAHGFGYDPVFWVPEVGQMMAELETAVKNRISHRGQALARLRTYLEGEKQED